MHIAYYDILPIFFPRQTGQEIFRILSSTFAVNNCYSDVFKGGFIMQMKILFGASNIIPRAKDERRRAKQLQ